MDRHSDPEIRLLPRVLQRATRLGGGGRVGIIYPAADPAYERMAGDLARELRERGGQDPECAADTALMPERSTLLPGAWRRRTLILIGSLNTNRALMPLYADYLCSTDATYPGGRGYDLRTLVNPYGAGANAILAGGSGLEGTGRAVGRLRELIASLSPPLDLPFTLEVELDPALAALLASWPQTPLEDTAELQANRTRGQMFYTEMIRIFSTYTLMWSWTGDPRYARVATENLRALNRQVKDGYGDWHYLAERFMRAFPLLSAGGFLSDEEIAHTERLLLHTALGTQDEWWRMRRGEPPLGHRHQGKGTYEFLLIARYLRDQARPSPALRALCDRWLGECRSFLDALCEARIDDQDDETTLNNLATMFRYALGQERHAFFTSGNARKVAERSLALHDNNGAGAGQGGYGEGLAGMMYYQQEATTQVAATAFYLGDGEMKWVLANMPNLSVPQRYSVLQYTAVFLQKFDTGPELPPVPPAQSLGVRALPLSGHQQAITVSPPVNVEYSGHMVNALETWEMPEGVGLNGLPREKGFDKIVFRGGFERGDAYLLLQGYQGGFRWQGHMQAANAIVRFYQAGHIFLIQNTSRHTLNDKNGLFISDGGNEAPMPPIAECVAAADFAPLGLTVTRLCTVRGAAWTRHIFWPKAGAGRFVVIDRAVLGRGGPLSVACTWRTPGHAEIRGRRWIAEQGEHRFTLVSGGGVAMTCEEEADQGAAAPFVLRQRIGGEFAAGAEVCFQNLFQVRALSDPEEADLVRRDDRSALVFENGAAVAWCGAALDGAASWLPGAAAAAESGWASRGILGFAAASMLKLPLAVEAGPWGAPGAFLDIECDQPIGILVELDKAAATLRLDLPGREGGKAVATLGKRTCELLANQPLVLALSRESCAQFSSDVAAWLAAQATRPERAGPPEESLPMARPPDAGFHSEGVYDGASKLAERVRNLRLTADPLPVDGYPDQLIDGVLPESRETWRQWPRAGHYAVTLTLPEPRSIASVSILGDCVDDPTLRSFRPLPEGIRLEAEGPDGKRHSCEILPAPERRYKRYRDAENRLQALSASVGRAARAFHLSIPAPADGGDLVLHELEVLGGRKVSPAVTHWIAADFDGDGRKETAAFFSSNELALLDEHGRERWRRPFPVALTHLSAQPLDAKGPPSLCLGLLGGELRILRADGSLRQAFQITENFRECRDILQGWFNAVHGVAVWRRDEDGRASLAVGGYAIVVFLDPDGRIAGHSWSDGPWNYDLLVGPENAADSRGLFVRCGWNHGIMQYEGHPGAGPSGAVLSFGGFNQPMFRRLRRITPFVNGRSLAFDWISLPSLPGGAILAAAELGCGVFSVRDGDWAWKREGGVSFAACVAGQVDGRPAAITGGADGFVCAIDMETGKLLRRHLVINAATGASSPVTGIVLREGGGLVVASRAGIEALDSAWRREAGRAISTRRMLALDAGRIAVVREDNAIEILATEP